MYKQVQFLKPHHAHQEHHLKLLQTVQLLQLLMLQQDVLLLVLQIVEIALKMDPHNVIMRLITTI